jgi:hypothetical protein
VEGDFDADEGADGAAVSAAVGSKRTRPATVSHSSTVALNIFTVAQLARELFLVLQTSQASRFCLSTERPILFSTTRAK